MRISGVENFLFHPSFSSRTCSCRRWEYPAWRRPYSILAIVLAPAVAADENIRRGGGLILSLAIVLAPTFASDENIRRRVGIFYHSFSSDTCSCRRWEYPAWRRRRPYPILAIILAPAVAADENIFPAWRGLILFLAIVLAPAVTADENILREVGLILS